VSTFANYKNNEKGSLQRAKEVVSSLKLLGGF